MTGRASLRCGWKPRRRSPATSTTKPRTDTRDDRSRYTIAIAARLRPRGAVPGAGHAECRAFQQAVHGPRRRRDPVGRRRQSLHRPARRSRRREPRLRASPLRRRDDETARAGARRQLHVGASRRPRQADCRARARRSQPHPALLERRGSGRSGRAARESGHRPARDHGVLGRLSRQDGRRAAALVGKLQARLGSARARSVFEPLRILGALLICDEMITGFGRTGKMFAVEHDAVVPDVLLVGKGFGGGFPVSGIVMREPIAFSKPWANPSGSSSSYGGNPLAAAAAHVTIRTIVDDDLVEHSRRLGATLLAEMQSWEDEIPIVSDVRGRGLMLGMDLVVPGTRRLLDKKITRWIFDTLLERGVIAMIYNPEVRINPPLVITEEQALEALATMRPVREGAGARVRG